MSGLTSGPPLVVAALAEEAAYVADAEVLVTGVGKAAAAAALARRLAEPPHPGLVVNIGTAGALDAAYTGVVEIGYVTQHDFPYAAIETLVGPGHVVPGYRLGPDRPPVAVAEAPAGVVRLATGDSFVADAAHAAVIAATGAHLVDMEAFALAAVCARFDVPLRVVKAVSDAADSEAVSAWREAVDRCARALAQHLTRSPSSAT